MSQKRPRRFGQIVNIPVLGYVLDFFVAIFRMPKNDLRIKQIRNEIRQISGRTSEWDQLAEQQRQLQQAWSRHVPAFLNAVSSVGALGHEVHRQKQLLDTNVTKLFGIADQNQSSFGELWQRLEFVRKEILFELASRTGAAARKLEPAILDEVKFQHQKAEGARLNLGCGHVPLNGYLNIDMRELPGVDIAAQLDNLPFEASSVKEIFSSHVLEHFTREHLRRDLLPYWRGLLQSGGVFRAIAPDGEAMVAALASGAMSFDDFREVLLGGQEYDGDFHYDFFSPGSLTELLAASGFVNVEIVAKARRNGKCFEFEITASNS
jgi:hypothetical protein